ncbi:3-oxoacyl-ACP reductase FabG [Chengkuizengella marina]|uniref:SDR family oxidoreductase n=1 Tax=Chengkuizengella marina TaxID=2507566 RepID=A0A6N9Q4Y5_9BACL|nr:3-oxoacyl-ACP reductase FabG [Chengkuizengella marina]NBI29811.1 SDR family oxidoreductase [Chengkuizengella marina]
MSDVQFNFKHKTALVTGGTRGIGKQIVQDLVKSGANVIFTYSSQEEAAQSIVRDLSSHSSSTIQGIQVDFRKTNDITKLTECLGKVTNLDFLVNNAGMKIDKPIYLLSEEDWKDVMNVNLMSAFILSKQFVRKLALAKGCIVNVSSVSGLAGTMGQTNYSAAKAGIIGFTKSLSKELASFGVRVNCVAPGYIETDMTHELIEEKGINMTHEIPLQRLGKPCEVSATVMFLLSQASSYITGKVIIPDGGLL